MSSNRGIVRSFNNTSRGIAPWNRLRTPSAMVWRRNRWAVHFAKELWTDLTDQTLHARLMDALKGQHGRRMMAGVETAKLTGRVTIFLIAGYACSTGSKGLFCL